MLRGVEIMFFDKSQLGGASALAIWLCITLVITVPIEAAHSAAQASISVTRGVNGETRVAANELAELKEESSAMVSIDGAHYEIAEGRVIELSASKSWIGRSTDQDVVLVATKNMFGHEISVLDNGKEHYQSIVSQEVPTVGITDIDPQQPVRDHRQAVRLALHQPRRARVDRGTGRIVSLRGQDIAQVRRNRLTLDQTFVDTLELTGSPVFESASLTGQSRKNRITQHFQQRIHGIPIRSYVRVEFDKDSGDVEMIDGLIFPNADAPQPARDDATKAIASTLLLEFATKTLSDVHTNQVEVSRLKREYLYKANLLRLGWSGTIRVGTKRYVVFLDAKTNEILHSDASRYNRTCSANNTTATSCDDPQTTLIIDTNGQCVSGVASSTCINHQGVYGDVNGALSDYSVQSPGGAPVANDVDILIDATLPTGADGVQDYNTDGTPYIRVGPEGTTSQETAAHEAAHVWTGSKTPSLQPDPGEDPGENALAEGGAYVMDSLHRDDLGNIDWPGAHVDNFDPNASGEQNSRPLQRAMYELVTDSVTVDFPQSEVYKVFTRAMAQLPNTNSCIDEDCLDEVRDTMRDVLEDMADDDEIPGSVKTKRKNEVNRAFGKVGLGPLAQSSNPPPPPPPSPPFFVLISASHSCFVAGDVGYTSWRVSWIGQPDATYYDVYSTSPTIRQLQISAPKTDYYVTLGPGGSVGTFVEACNAAGCSFPSNTLTLTYQSQCNF